MIDAEPAWWWLREVPAIQILRRIWIQQFYVSALSEPVRWHVAEDLPPALQLISSPYDPDACWSRKRETRWVGYKVHLTETADADLPHMVTNVETAEATTADNSMTYVIPTHLAERDLLPSEHLVDTGYVTSDHLVESQERQVDLVGPVREDSCWQTWAAAGFGVSCFAIDWEAQQATCPQGKRSVIWDPTRDNPDSYPDLTNGGEKPDERPAEGFAKRASLSRWFAIQEDHHGNVPDSHPGVPLPSRRCPPS